MKLDRLHYFADEIAKDGMISGAIANYSIYYYFKNAFIALNGQPAPANLVQFLEKTKKKKGVWREASCTTTYFFSAEFDAVVVADFHKAPRTETQDYFNLAITNCARHASNAFLAAHDTLTELLNRHSLEQQLNSILSANIAVSGADLADQQQVAVLAFDLDHFKQVNDTYGHLYGDIVLKSFARRLESFAQRLSEEGTLKGRAEFIVSRPGGEEFTVVERGSLSDTEVCELAKRFCEEIAKMELPTEDEWKQYEELSLTTGLQFPPDQERRITCSVGVVSQVLPVIGTPIEQIRNSLLNRADLALYKAKTSGRNRICFFPEIVKRYGRILEVNPETDIVVIDLGSEIGLKHGQELFVFHPKFDGSADYIHKDGRTTKRMGLYPRVHSARIEAFDVQKEISFCRILERIPTNSDLIKDSWLEAVPLGAIDHLVKASTLGGLISSKNVAGPLPAEVIRKRIAELEEKHPLCAVFRIANEEEVIENLGPTSISKILANLYSALQKRFPLSATIGYVQPTQFALVLSDNNNLNIQLIGEALTEVNNIYGGKIRVIAGIFDSSEKNTEYWRDGKVNYSKALELAGLASLVPELNGASPYKIFNYDSLQDIVLDLEKVRGQELALADLKKLSEIGIETAWFENVIGKLAFSLRNYDCALEAVLKAHELNNSEPVYRSNAALVYYLKGMFKDAYEAFNDANKIDGRSIPIHSFGPWALSANSARLEGLEIPIKQVISLIDQAVANKDQQLHCDIHELVQLREQLTMTT